MKLLIILLAFLSFTIDGFSQTGQIEGKLTDAGSGLKISAVSVEVDGTKSGVATNTDGRFVLTLQAGKKYSIKLSSVGYQSKILDDVEVLANQTTNLDIVLDRLSKTEEAVVVRSICKKRNYSCIDRLSKKYICGGTGDQC